GIRVFHVTGVQTCALPICSMTGPISHFGSMISRLARRGSSASHPGSPGLFGYRSAAFTNGITADLDLPAPDSPKRTKGRLASGGIGRAACRGGLEARAADR